VDDVFGPGGTLASTLPGYEPRPEQGALAEAVARRAGPDSPSIAAIYSRPSAAEEKLGAS